MPQMSPLNWLNLFITTVTIFMILNSLNYFMFTNKPSSKNSKFVKNSKNWKW